MVGTVGERRRRGRFAGLACSVVSAIILSIGITGNGSAFADEPLPLVRGRLSDTEWIFLQSFIIQQYAGGDANGFADMFRGWYDIPTRREAWSYIRRARLAAEHYDLDGDGTDELLVRTVLGCGTIGCPTFIFSRGTEGWRQVDEIISGSDGDHCIVILRPGDLPILRTYRVAIWWTGSAYDWICLYDCSADQAARHPEMRAALAERDCSESK